MAAGKEEQAVDREGRGGREKPGLDVTLNSWSMGHEPQPAFTQPAHYGQGNPLHNIKDS
jgi:hypothetical protein